MSQVINRQRLLWILSGILVGALLSFLLPAEPLHAVATSGQDSFLLATGWLDSNLEGVYFLDGLTGVLKGAALNINTGTFTTVFETNVLADLKLETTKAPKFLMVTGQANLRRGPTMFQPGESVIYVTEINSGVQGVYAVRWNIGRSTQPTPAMQATSFYLMDRMQWRNVALRPQ